MKRLLAIALLLVGLGQAFAQIPPPVPPLPDTERRTQYTISGTTCACSVNFALYGDSTDFGNWIEVWVNGVLQASSTYTITSATGPLATIPRPITDALLTFNAATTGTVQIVGARRPRRATQVAENQGVPARAFNQTISDIVAVERELWDKTNDVTGRAVLAPPGETLLTLPPQASRQNLGACFDANGNVTTCVSVPASTFSAGNGITLSGAGPTTITNNIAAGRVTITGANPLTVTNNIAAGAGINITGTNPKTISAAGVVSVTVQTFTSSGTYTPHAGLISAIVEACGGGGGGGGAAGTTASTQISGGSGGAAGGYTRKLFTAATIGASRAVTIGAGGAAAGSSAGGAGGATTFGALLTANGGGGGVFVAATSALAGNGGANGGTASGGDVNIQGSGGGDAYSSVLPNSAGLLAWGGQGGPGYGATLSPQPTTTAGGSLAGLNAQFCGGGSGAVGIGTASAQAGGTGGGGAVFITEFNNQ